MGSSAKKKREKKQDFKKATLKVGKAKPKPANQTDTSFRSKSIVLNQQSLRIAAPDSGDQFQHHVSLLSSKSDTQRKESIAFLTNYVTDRPRDVVLPQSTGTLLDQLCPLILDANNNVRIQVLKFLRASPDGFQDHVGRMLPYIRAGMTHLSRDVRASAIDTLSFLLHAYGDEVVSCSGSWQKTLDSFVTLLGWKSTGSVGSWSTSRMTLNNDVKTTVRVMQVLERFLSVGLEAKNESPETFATTVALNFPLVHVENHCVPSGSKVYRYLNLYGDIKVEDDQMLEDRDDRLALFNDRFRSFVFAGVESAKQQGGELGRAAGPLIKLLGHVDSNG